MVKHGRAEVKSVKEQVLELSQRLFGADACRKIRSMHYLLGRLIIKQIWSAGIGLCAQLCALLQKILRGSQAMAKYHSKVIRGESKGWKRSGQAEKASIYAAVPVMAAAAAYS